MYSLCARRANAYVSFKKAQVLAQAHGSFKLCQRYLETDAPTQPASLSETHLVGHGKQPGTNEPSEMVDWLFQASSPVEQSMPKATKIPENPVIVEETKEDVPNSSAASGSNSKSRSILVRVGGEAKRMADYLSIIHEIENRFGKIQDFRIQKDQELGSYMKTINVNFENLSSVEAIRKGGIMTLHCLLPRKTPTLSGPGSALNEVQRYLSRTRTPSDSSPQAATDGRGFKDCECEIRISNKPFSSTYFPRRSYTHQQINREFINWGGFGSYEFRSEGSVKPADPTLSTEVEPRNKATFEEAQWVMENAIQQARVELYRMGDPACGLVSINGNLEFAPPSPPKPQEMPEAPEGVRTEYERGEDVELESQETLEVSQGTNFDDAPATSEVSETSSDASLTHAEHASTYVQPLSAREREELAKLYRSFHNVKSGSDISGASSAPTTSDADAPQRAAQQSEERSAVVNDSPYRGADGEEVEMSQTDEQRMMNNRERRMQRKSQKPAPTQKAAFTSKLLGWIGR